MPSSVSFHQRTRPFTEKTAERESTWGGDERSMGKKSVGVAGVLQLGRGIGPSMVGVLIQQSKQAGSGHTEHGRLSNRMERANGATTEGGICPTTIVFRCLQESMNLSEKYPLASIVCGREKQRNRRNVFTERSRFNHIMPTSCDPSSSGSRVAERCRARLFTVTERA